MSLPPQFTQYYSHSNNYLLTTPRSSLEMLIAAMDALEWLKRRKISVPTTLNDIQVVYAQFMSVTQTLEKFVSVAVNGRCQPELSALILNLMQVGMGFMVAHADQVSTHPMVGRVLLTLFKPRLLHIDLDLDSSRYTSLVGSIESFLASLEGMCSYFCV